MTPRRCANGADFLHAAKVRESLTIYFVAVLDVEGALRRAESLRGTRVRAPATSPNGLVVGHFTDPEGGDRSAAASWRAQRP